MKVEVLLTDLKARGVDITPSNGRLCLRAKRGVLNQPLVETIRAHKAEILAELGEMSREPTHASKRSDVPAKRRWGLPPAGSVPLTDLRPILTESDRKLVTDAIARQSRIRGCEGVVRWILGDGGQADRYNADRCWPTEDCVMAATIDLLLLQNDEILRGETREERVEALLDRLDMLEAGFDT